MNREAQRVSVEQAMFMAGNNVELAAAWVGYNGGGA